MTISKFLPWFHGLLLTVLDEFPRIPRRSHYPDLGSGLTLQCTPPRSNPSAEIFWVAGTSHDTFSRVNITDRISQDPFGKRLFTSWYEWNSFWMPYNFMDVFKVVPDGYPRYPDIHEWMPSSVWFGKAYMSALRSSRPLETFHHLRSCQKSSPSYKFNSLNFDSE